MEIVFHKHLAEALQRFCAVLVTDPGLEARFSADPTAEVKSFLHSAGVVIPTPDLFHVHAMNAGDQLPLEPKRSKIDRYIYVFRASGLFEFKLVPGSPDGNDTFMRIPEGPCDCCSCIVIYR